MRDAGHLLSSTHVRVAHQPRDALILAYDPVRHTPSFAETWPCAMHTIHPDRFHVPVPALPPLPPRSATEIVDGAVQLVRPEFGYFLRIAAVGAIPALIQAVVTLVCLTEAGVAVRLPASVRARLSRRVH